MIHPGAHHNKQLTHAAAGRDIKFHAGCAVIYAATHARGRPFGLYGAHPIFSRGTKTNRICTP